MSSDLARLTAWALPDVPLVQPGDDLVALIQAGLQRAQTPLQNGDVVVVASKIVSKAENRAITLSDITPSAEAHERAAITGKDPRLVELILRESTAVSRQARGVLVTVHRLGFVSANAGIDQSNIAAGGEQALLLPLDPDVSARQLREGLREASGVDVGVIISDTHGRPFRFGNVGVAIGVAGLPAMIDMRGERDLYGRELAITVRGYADMIASTAHLLSGEGAEGRPVVILRGLEHPSGDGRAAELNRPPEQDLYR